MRKRISLAILAVGLAAVSCVTPYNMAYIRDLEYNHPYDAKPAPELRLQTGDRIRIQVFSEDPALAVPFNAGIITTEGGTVATMMNTYTLDKDGNIDFPVLGALNIEGRTIKEVKELISGQIRDLGYIKNPVVSVNMDNFKIIVMGEIQPNVVTVNGESITLLEALVNGTSARERVRISDVMVVRTENGVRTAYSINMQTKAMFDSPVYYLQQNDIVYVKPKGWRVSQNFQNFVGIIGTGMNFATMITTLTLYFRDKK